MSRVNALRVQSLRHALMLVLVSVSTLAAAQSDDNALRPSGPVTLTADHGEWTQGGDMRYEGHVALQSDTLTIRGDLMRITQRADGQFNAEISGTPAELAHAAQPDAKGVAAQAVSAQAQTIHYDSSQGLITLRDAAQLTRGSDAVSGKAIDYYVAQRRVRASGGGGNGQVRIVIQPPPKSTGAPAATPAASAPPAETTP